MLRRGAHDLLGRLRALRRSRRAPVDDHRRRIQPAQRGLVADAPGHRQRGVDQLLAALLVGLEDRQQPGHARPLGAVGLRQPLERLAEQFHALGVHRAVRADLREPERGAGHPAGVAVAAGGGRGLGVAAAAGLDVAGGEGGLGEREQRRAALGGGRLGAERERLQRFGVVRRRLGVAERGGRLAGGVQRRLPRGLRIGAAARGGERVVGDLGRGHVRARVPAHGQRRRDGLVQRAAPLRGQPLEHRVADDPVREREMPGRLAGDHEPGRLAAVQRPGHDVARHPGGAHEIGDREAPGDRADLQHRADIRVELVEAAAHDLAHAHGNQRPAVVADPALRRDQAHQLGDVERVAAGAGVDRVRLRHVARAAARARRRRRGRPAPGARRAGCPRSRAGRRSPAASPAV